MKNNGKTKITEKELRDLITRHVKGDKIKLNGVSLVGLRWLFRNKNRMPRRLDGCEITNSYIEGGDLNYLEFKGSNFQGTVFKNCELTGVAFWDAQMDGCTFIDCSMLSVEMENANLKGSHFHNCDMRWGRVSGADFDGATFEKTSLDKTLHSTAKGLKIS
jgi:uncharacterized protein YjbI with pentapeptide repeats